MTYMRETTPTVSPEVSWFCLKEHWTPLYVRGGEQGLPVHPSNTPVGSLKIASFKLARHASAKHNATTDGQIHCGCHRRAGARYSKCQLVLATKIAESMLTVVVDCRSADSATSCQDAQHAYTCSLQRNKST